MTEKHKEPGIVDPEELLLNWPLTPVSRSRVSEKAHHHAVEFKKQSGAAPEKIDDLMNRHNTGGDLDSYFERRLSQAGQNANTGGR